MSDPPNPNKDFTNLRRSGLSAGTTKSIGMGFVNTRNWIATRLVRLGVRPNHLTVTGFVITLGAAACFAFGAGDHAPYESAVEGVRRSYWPLLAAVFLILSNACDMLDGAVARIGNSGTPFGGVLDSTLDRCSDIATHLGICLFFAYHGNVTYMALAFLAMTNGYMVSYVKARAEDLIDDCTVGYWLRGERCAGMVLACLCSHVPAYLWIQAISPAFTVLARLRHAYRALTRGPAVADPPPRDARRGVLARFRHGYTTRGTVPYDMVTFGCIASFTVAPWIHPFFYGTTDPLRSLLTWLTG
jgi:CDP-diacylglycerol--glycerol-3-phosphate 3-phosphatidyltransferase